ncbi:hypothetical protein ACIHAA_13995 [Streptomyces sp. NPDC052040]|uniref:hypothetical protein n=1 Tax=Streptomyces sp. NPDC052040 TaxID=3365682 RepID=UPI0037D56D3B
MGISSRHALTSAATALLLCLVTAGTASAEEVPADNVTPNGSVSDSAAISASQTTDMNDRAGWDDAEGRPLSDNVPAMCDTPSTWYSITSKQAIHIPSWWNGTKYKDGPGGTMTVVVTKGGTISADVTGTGEYEIGGVIWKAKGSVSVKIGGSVTVTTGHTYSRTIAKNRYGHLQYGSWGYKVTWKKYRSGGGANCGGVEIGHGSATLPTSETGWKYWETAS